MKAALQSAFCCVVSYVFICYVKAENDKDPSEKKYTSLRETGTCKKVAPQAAASVDYAWKRLSIAGQSAVQESCLVEILWFKVLPVNT